MGREGMEINILIQEGMGMFLYATTGMGWEWKYRYGNGREWDRKSHSRTCLLLTSDAAIVNSMQVGHSYDILLFHFIKTFNKACRVVS